MTLNKGVLEEHKDWSISLDEESGIYHVRAEREGKPLSDFCNKYIPIEIDISAKDGTQNQIDEAVKNIKNIIDSCEEIKF